MRRGSTRMMDPRPVSRMDQALGRDAAFGLLSAADLRALGEPLAGLPLTCVGMPAYRNKRGGPPRSPVPIGTMRPG